MQTEIAMTPSEIADCVRTMEQVGRLRQMARNRFETTANFQPSSGGPKPPMREPGPYFCRRNYWPLQHSVTELSK
jgi:hypothetical protein